MADAINGPGQGPSLETAQLEDLMQWNTATEVQLALMGGVRASLGGADAVDDYVGMVAVAGLRIKPQFEDMRALLVPSSEQRPAAKPPGRPGKGGKKGGGRVTPKATAKTSQMPALSQSYDMSGLERRLALTAHAFTFKLAVSEALTGDSARLADMEPVTLDKFYPDASDEERRLVARFAEEFMQPEEAIAPDDLAALFPIQKIELHNMVTFSTHFQAEAAHAYLAGLELQTLHPFWGFGAVRHAFGIGSKASMLKGLNDRLDTVDVLGRDRVALDNRYEQISVLAKTIAEKAINIRVPASKPTLVEARRRIVRGWNKFDVSSDQWVAENRRASTIAKPLRESGAEAARPDLDRMGKLEGEHVINSRPWIDLGKDTPNAERISRAAGLLGRIDLPNIDLGAATGMMMLTSRLVEGAQAEDPENDTTHPDFETALNRELDLVQEFDDLTQNIIALRGKIPEDALRNAPLAATVARILRHADDVRDIMALMAGSGSDAEATIGQVMGWFEEAKQIVETRFSDLINW
jgi:hypothetical protein